jgi:hypothetical protein
MNGGNQVLFSRGIQISNINGNINKKEYNAMYDGNKGKMILNDNGRKYYIEADDDDIHKLLNQPKSSIGIERKLKNIVKKPRRKTKKRIKIKSPTRRKRKVHYTVKKKSPSKKRKKRKTPSRKKTPSKKKTPSRKKTPSKKKTNQRLLPDNLLKTII